VQITIIDFEKILYQDEKVNSITVPGLDGYFQILENHAPLISVLGYGLIKISHHNKDFKMKINGGFLQVKKNVIVVIL
jgi:F-type H+-transporting ATPase subunit epsilon